MNDHGALSLATRRFVTRIDRRLNGATQFLRDLEAADIGGFKFRYAVDFAPIFNYAYPTVGLAKEFEKEADAADPADRAESRSRAFASQQIALVTGLWSRLEYPLVVFPPHLTEMVSHFAWYQMRMSSLKQALTDRAASNENILIRELERNPATWDVAWRLEKAIESKQEIDLSPGDVAELISAIELHFPPLWAVLTSNIGTGPNRIMNRKREEKWVTLPEAFPGINVREKSIANDSAKWIARLDKKREGEGRTLSNKRDGQALEYLRVVNRQVNPETVVLLITQTAAVAEVTSDEEFISVPNLPDPISATRGVYWLLAAAVNTHQDNPREVDVDNLTRHIERLQGFLNRTKEYEASPPLIRLGIEKSFDEYIDQIEASLRKHAYIHYFLDRDPEALEKAPPTTDSRVKVFNATGFEPQLYAFLKGNGDLNTSLVAKAQQHLEEVEGQIANIEQLIKTT